MGMLDGLALSTSLIASAACMALVLVGAAVQVAIGAGLSVICGSFLLLWVGADGGVPILLCLNLVVSVVATACGAMGVRWGDVILASTATLAGCFCASLLPSLPAGVVKGMTTCVLIVIALPRSPAPGIRPSSASIHIGVALAGLTTGALTVWTATPGPITPVALARSGRSGDEIRRTMQPISVVGYGAALAWVGAPSFGTASIGTFWGLVGATLLGTGLGFQWRSSIDPARVVLLIRVVAATAALLLLSSLLH
jgi:uncharacterized protein